jgi:hypothetical protein
MSEHSATSEIRTSAGERALQIVALCFFLGVGSFFALPWLSPGGDTRGIVSITVLILAFSRLGWSFYKRTFGFGDYVLYLVIVIAFGLWADLRQGH